MDNAPLRRYCPPMAVCFDERILQSQLIPEPCSVVSQGCEAPANLLYYGEPGAGFECFACGMPVCDGICCSIERDYLTYGTQRICAACEDLHFKDAELSLRQRAYKQAGYENWFLLGARDYADSVVQQAERQLIEIWRINQVLRRRGRRGSFHDFSARHRVA
jgi:hypothetical protein